MSEAGEAPSREDLVRAVHSIVNECLVVKPGENVLVVANPGTLGLGERIRGEAGRAGADAVLAMMAERDSHAAEPPPTIANAMLAADVIFAPTIQSLSHTAARKAASEAGARIATLPGVTEEMLARVMSADMEGLRRKGRAIADLLDTGDEVRITCTNGSDLTITLGGRRATPDAGELDRLGAFGNLPCGEGFIAPLSAEGTLVVDGSIAGVGLVEEPVRLTIEGGHLKEASGQQGATLMALLTAHGPDGTNIAELGIGTNEKAILTGEILEDEKILGTAHIAFGASKAIGGNVQVPVHLDCVILRPRVMIGATLVADEGRLLVG